MAPKKTPNNRVRKTVGKPVGNIINTTIEMRPIQRLQGVDTGSLRNATRSAESLIPRRVQLYNLYFDLSQMDGHWGGVWSKRVDAVTSADWIFTDANGDPVDEVNELIDCIGFEDILTELINTKGWGKTLLEPSFFINDNERNEVLANLIPRKHCRPDIKMVTKDETSDTGVNYKEGIYAKTVMDIGKDNDLGLFLSAAGYAILKRGALGDWASFVEKFGQPIIDGVWDGFDDAQRLALSTALNGMGSGGVIIRPKGTEIEAIMPTTNATGALQMNFVDFCNKEISKGLLGSTETTESSSSSGYAQSETHLKEDNKKNETDINYVRRYLNSEFIKVLISAGFNVKGGTFVLKSEKELDKKDAFDVHLKMAEKLNIPIDHNFFYEEYGMPKPKDYDAQIAERKKEAEAIAKTPTDDNPDNPKPPKKEKEVKLSDRLSIRGLLDFFRPARSIKLRATENDYLTFKHDLNSVYTQCCAKEARLIKLADMPKSFGDLIDILIRKIFDLQQAPEFDFDLFDTYANELTNAVLKGLGSNETGDFTTHDQRLIDSLKNNVHQFSAAKTYQELKAMGAALVDSNNQVRSWSDFKIVAEQIAQTQLNWLKTEYETAIGSGQMAAKWALIQEQKDLFPLLMFDAVIDENSTELCSSLNGVIKPVDDDFWKIYFPLNHFKCRSTVRQLRDGIITPDDEIKFPATMPEMFKRNLAAEGIVFPDEHAFYNDVPKSVLERARPNE